MPVTRPADKNKDRSEWWKKSDELPEEARRSSDVTIPDPKNTPDVSAEMRKDKFNEEQRPIEFPV